MRSELHIVSRKVCGAFRAARHGFRATALHAAARRTDESGLDATSAFRMFKCYFRTSRTNVSRLVGRARVRARAVCAARSMCRPYSWNDETNLRIIAAAPPPLDSPARRSDD